jgi:hypothetical protein
VGETEEQGRVKFREDLYRKKQKQKQETEAADAA